MQKVQHIIGADLSKDSIDFASPFSNNHIRVDNNAAGFSRLLKWLRQQKLSVSKIMIVMEHTGLYSYVFENFLHSRRIAFTKVSALAIKRSSGLIRGKSDKLDAFRIAAYGHEKREKLKVDQPRADNLKRLSMLYSTREKMVRQRAGLLSSVKEYTHIGIASNDLIVKSQLQMIKAFDKQIERLEAEMKSIVDTDVALKQNYYLLQSIKGVGKVLALATLIKTHNFSRFTDARKFACFCGTAPFEHSSGTSVRGRTKISHLADKQMKTLLNLSAKTAIQYDKELREYYLKRTEKGKPKMNTINVVRNKIIYRMFAVIKRQTPFVENYLYAA
jgi:transposase